MKQRSASITAALFVLVVGLFQSGSSFVLVPPLQPPAAHVLSTASRAACGSRTQRHMMPPSLSSLDQAMSSQPPMAASLTLSANTLDPTSFFNGVFGSLIDIPLILAVPILAGLGVTGLIVLFLIKSSEPAETD